MQLSFLSFYHQYISNQHNFHDHVLAKYHRAPLVLFKKNKEEEEEEEEEENFALKSAEDLRDNRSFLFSAYTRTSLMT